MRSDDFGESIAGCDGKKREKKREAASRQHQSRAWRNQVGIFSGHVKVADPRFTLQSEKLTVYVTKGENQGLEKAIAEGNVAVVRDRPDPNGGAPTRAVGRSDQATYIASTGNVELRGTPRVQEGVNTHIATSADTVMVVNQNGQLTTHGPSRTEIRQEPKTEEQKNETKPTPSPKPPGTS